MAEDRESWREVAEASAARVEGWLATLIPSPAAVDAGFEEPDAPGGSDPDLLEGVRRDADGLAFSRRLLESVVSAGDPFVAALGLRSLSRELPASLPARDRAAVKVGGLASLALPWAVLPVARRWLRERVSHLALSVRLPDEAHPDGRLAELRAALLGRTAAGMTTALALGGDAVLGPDGAAREAERLRALAALPEVSELLVDPARLAPETPSGCWTLEADAARGAALLRTVLEAARAHGVRVLLEPRDYRGALLAPELLLRALADPPAADPALDETASDGAPGDALDESGLELELEPGEGPESLAGALAGLSLPAELPESLGIAERLILASRERVAAGGEPLELVAGVAGLAGREQVASILSGLAVPALESRADRSAQLLRLTARLLDAAADGSVRVAVASEDPHLLAASTILTEQKGVAASLVLQLRSGTAPALAATLVAHDQFVRQRLPISVPEEFAGLVDELLDLAAESAEAGSTLDRLAGLVAGDRVALAAEREELRRAAELAAEAAPESRRTQRRDREWDQGARDTSVFYRSPTEPARFDTGGLTAAVLGLSRDETGRISLEAVGQPKRVPAVSATGFANEPDTDASCVENRAWVRELLRRAKGSVLGSDAAAAAQLAAEDPEPLIGIALAAGEPWRAQPLSERATRVRRLALGTVAARDRLTEALAAETGAPAAVIDAEIGGAVDAARYLGQLADGLVRLRGAEFRPDRLALVVADAAAPLAERAEAVLAVLAAGSSALLVAHPSVARSSAVLLEEWRAAGLPDGIATLLVGTADEIPAAEDGDDPTRAPSEAGAPSILPGPPAHVELAARIAADARIDRALVLGRRDTATALLRLRPDLRVEGRFRALGAVLVASSADPTAAARAVAASAFAAGSADPRIARAVVCFGAAARSSLFKRQLADAVRALRAGDTARPEGDPLSLDLGPLPEPPGEAGLRALTELAAGEAWLVKPERLDEEGRLWSPGVRIGLRRDARFWRDAAGMPVIGLVAARTLDEAIELQNALAGGGVAGLHALAASETLPWLERARAATLRLGLPTTGGRIERSPGGGWDAAGMGFGALAGGPNRLVTLGSWGLRQGTASPTLHLRGLRPEVQVLIESSQPVLEYPEFDRVRRAALSDALAWRTELGGMHDVSGLGIERNLLRHRAVPTHVRLAEAGSLAELVRVLAAGLVVGAPMTVSTGEVLPAEISGFLASQEIPVSLERDDAWLERLAAAGVRAGSEAGREGEDEEAPTRVRLIGGDRVRAAEWLGRPGRIALWADPVTMAGPVELLVFLREQSVSIAAHRHGFAALPPGVGEWIAELQAQAGARQAP